MKFTRSQQTAIDLRDRNILISAAAGSGKTATLTERIIKLLTDKDNPADISSMLIVTFTRAAAGELRARISRELGKALALDPGNRHLARQLTALGSAMICTIDSYYLDLVRSNFQRLSIPASFRLADETELLLLRYEVMNAVIERRYESDVEFSDFADEITTARAEGMLAQSLINLSYKINNLPEGTEYLAHCANAYKEESKIDFFRTRAGKYMLRDLKIEIAHLIRKCDMLISIIDSDPAAAPYGRAVASDRDHLNLILQSLNQSEYSETRKIIFDYVPVALGSVKSANKNENTERVSKERGEVKNAIIKYRSREFSLDPDDMEFVCLKHSKFCFKMKEVLDDYFAAYDLEKKTRNICEFSDLRRYALELLLNKDGSPSATALDQRKRFSHIFVDEYQDTDSVQDKVFGIISRGNNLFFVGDIKQSIYRFRGAEPSVFAAYRRSYLPAEGRTDIPGIPLSVFMSENFRCSPNIISFTNAVCSFLFRETECDGGGIGYIAEDDLIASRGEPNSKEKVKIVLLEKDKDYDFEGNPEHAYVISEITKILRTKTKPDGTPYKPCDIAILTQTNSEAAAVSESLAKAGIPHANSTGNDLFENPEVLLMLSILSAVDNPQRDIQLAAALRSPIFKFNLTDLVNVRIGRDNISLYDALCEYSESSDTDDHLRSKCISALQRIEYYKTEAESMPVHNFMRSLWKDTNALSYAGSDPDSVRRTPAERRRNLRKFYEYARRYEASSFKGLHDFVEYIGGIINQGTKISDEDAVTDNTVQIMTVHKSKGLEFPTVFLIGCDKSANEQEYHQSMLFTPSEDIGLALRVSDTTGLAQVETPFRVAASNRMSSLSSEEQIRVLYVALTRAKDDLYVIASGNNTFCEKLLDKATRQAELGGRQVVINTTKWIERILTALSADPINRSYVIEMPPLESYLLIKETATEERVLDETRINEICNALRPSLNFKYPDNASSQIPAKLSVSKLYPELLNETDDAASLLARVESMETRKPRFVSDESNAAEKGTATHLFMQFCKFENLKPTRESVNEEIARLVTEKFIPPKVAKLIRVNEILKFASSEFFKMILAAQNVQREFRFNVFLPATMFTSEQVKKELLGTEQILVQGVIDLFFTDNNGKIILCDYKTDRLTKDELANPILAANKMKSVHGEQLEYYAKAIEIIYGSRPDKIYIFSLCLGKEIEIKI